MRRPAAALLLLAASWPSVADEGCGALFVVHRSLNANVVLYEARFGPDGFLDAEKPVRVQWRLDARDGRREDLNFVERLRAYGVDVVPLGERDAFRVTVRALPTRPLVLHGGAGCPFVTASIGGRDAILRRVFVSTSGGLLPRVSRVELSGTDLETAQPVVETFSPVR